MAKAIHKAKDNSFKVILDEPELFVEFLQDYIPVDVLKGITPEDVEDMTERYIPLFEDHRDSDIVKRVNLKGTTPLYVIAIVEHESQVNYRTCFKMLQYIALVLNEYEKEADKEAEKEANKNSDKKTKRRVKISETKGFKYPPVLPIVFYDGAGKWTAARKLADKTVMGGIFEKYIPSFEYELVSLKDYKPEEIEDVTDHWNERRTEKMFDYIKGYDVQETKRIASAEGKAEGIIEGIIEGKIETALKMLADGVPVEMIIKYTGLTRAEVMSLKPVQ